MLAQSMSVSIRAQFNVGVIKILFKAVERVKAKYLEIELFRSQLMMKSTLLYQPGIISEFRFATTRRQDIHWGCLVTSPLDNGSLQGSLQWMDRSVSSVGQTLVDATMILRDSNLLIVQQCHPLSADSDSLHPRGCWDKILSLPQQSEWSPGQALFWYLSIRRWAEFALCECQLSRISLHFCSTRLAGEFWSE